MPRSFQEKNTARTHCSSVCLPLPRIERMDTKIKQIFRCLSSQPPEGLLAFFCGSSCFRKSNALWWSVNFIRFPFHVKCSSARNAKVKCTSSTWSTSGFCEFLPFLSIFFGHVWEKRELAAPPLNVFCLSVLFPCGCHHSLLFQKAKEPHDDPSLLRHWHRCSVYPL